MVDASLPPFSFSFTPEFPELLHQLDCSLLLSTYQAGKVIAISSDGEKITQLPRNFESPMGMAIEDERMAVATRDEIILLANEPRLAPIYPNKQGVYDALYFPRSTHYCGRMAVHDIAYGADGLVGVNTAFSCLFHLDDTYNFVPIWRPPFITAIASEDRCHLNGMALVDGKPKYVTALGTTDTPGGWRDDKLTGGILMDVDSNEILLDGLPMPHSPRVIDGELYLLLSASGELVRVNPDGGYDTLCQVDGFLRGMVRWGDYLFIGCSKLRKTHTFGDLPLARNTSVFCGVVIIHKDTGALVSQIKYINSCEEIYDVQILPHILRPNILGTGNDTHKLGLSTPDSTFWARQEDLEG